MARIGAGVAFFGVILIGIGTGASEGSAIGSRGAVGARRRRQLLDRRAAPEAGADAGCRRPGHVAGLPHRRHRVPPFSGQLIAEVGTRPQRLLGVVYLGAVPTALAFSTWAYALARMPAGQLGVTTYVVPALVVLFGWLLFGEIPARWPSSEAWSACSASRCPASRSGLA